MAIYLSGELILCSQNAKEEGHQHSSEKQLLLSQEGYKAFLKYMKVRVRQTIVLIFLVSKKKKKEMVAAQLRFAILGLNKQHFWNNVLWTDEIKVKICFHYAQHHSLNTSAR